MRGAHTFVLHTIRRSWITHHPVNAVPFVQCGSNGARVVHGFDEFHHKPIREQKQKKQKKKAGPSGYGKPRTMYFSCFRYEKTVVRDTRTKRINGFAIDLEFFTRTKMMTSEQNGRFPVKQHTIVDIAA